MPTPRTSPTSEAINGTVYVIGGADFLPHPVFGGEHKGYSVNEAYDIESGVWQKKAPMPTPRDHHKSTVIDGKIYVVGGSQTSIKATVGANEVYNPITDKWEVLEPLPTIRGALGVTSLNGTIFAFGGLAEENVSLDTVEQFIPNQGWIEHPSMPTAAHGLGTITVSEKIYLIGGVSDHGLIPINVSYYDPNVIPEFNSAVPIAYGIEEMIWESNMPLPTLRAEFAFTTYDDKIYLIGGFDKTESALDVVEVYDTKTKKQTLGQLYLLYLNPFIIILLLHMMENCMLQVVLKTKYLVTLDCI